MLTENLEAILAKRFRHYTPGVDLGFIQSDQPGIRSVDGGTYPVILLKNDVFWFPAREARPEKDGRSVKAKGPGRLRVIMIDDPSLDEIVVVEGEGDAFAMRIVGYTGIAIAGGTNNLLDPKPEAVKNRKEIFGGKNVRILFDDDDPGKKGAVKGARQLLIDGASRVAIVALKKADDVEDWIETFDEPSDALRELTHLIGGSTWETDSELAKQEDAAEKKKDTERTSSMRIFIPGDILPRLIAMTHERKNNRLLLARYGPIEEPKLAAPGYGDTPEIAADVARGWVVAPEHEIQGTVYFPDRSDAIREYLRYGTLILPPPPTEKLMPSVELWVALRGFIERWVVVPIYAADVMVAYALLTWRLEDAGFRHVPYLRFFGPPGTGKGRALDVMRQLCWRSFSTHPTSQNLHRIIDFFGDITLFIDEFHIDASRGESQQQIIDTLCLGYDRSQPVARVVQGAKGRQDEIKNFHLFGPKVFAGYGADEHEALARRSVAIEMTADAEIPREMSPLGLPEEFHAEGERLRSHLLAWRGKNLAKGAPDPLKHPHAITLSERAGNEVAQVFFPLLAMVPSGLEKAREQILTYSEGRRKAVRDTRAVTGDAFLLEAFVEAATGPEGFRKGETFYATPQLIFDIAGDRLSSVATVGQKLKALGFRSVRPTTWGNDDGRRRYYAIDEKNAHHLKILARAGVRLPKKPRATDVGAAGKAAL